MDEDDDESPLKIIIEKERKIIKTKCKIKKWERKSQKAGKSYKNTNTFKFAKNNIGNANRVHQNSTRNPKILSCLVRDAAHQIMDKIF